MSADYRKLAQFYDQKYDEYGLDVRSVGWGNVESQTLRFSVLCDIANLADTSVCDLGCGFGDLSKYLQSRFNNVSYYGIDLSVKMIAQARKCYPGFRFQIEDILEEPQGIKYDYVLSSGSLSYKLEHHEQYVDRMLRAMFAMSNKGVAVNFLSSYVDYQLGKNFHLSPEKAFEWGRGITPYVALRHDYPLYEFTLYLYRCGSGLHRHCLDDSGRS